MFRSLRARLCLALCGLLTAAVFTSAAAFFFFSRDQLLDERENCMLLARQFASTLNHVLANSSEPQKTLHDFVSNMNRLSPGMVGYVPVDSTPPMDMTPQTVKGVPQWFTNLIAEASPAVDEQFPILVNGKRIGDLIVMPDTSADIHEKWITFLGIFGSALVLALLSSVIVYFTVGAAFAPFYQLSQGLTSLREGKYEFDLSPGGPPEFQSSLVSLNKLAVTLRDLRDENRQLLRRIVSVQDEERNELSRELHDELGPLLFAVRANAGAVKDSLTQSENTVMLSRLMDAAQSLQQIHRRILDRLRPLHLKELGLTESIKGLARNMDQQVPNLIQELDIDPAIEHSDEITSRTIYRVIQEALTNVMQHAKASRVELAIQATDEGINIRVSDDGIGFSEPPLMGRGLTGMRERVRALGGKLSIERKRNRTVLISFLPAATST